MANPQLKYVLRELRDLMRKQTYPKARDHFAHLISVQERGIEEVEYQRIEDRMAGARNLDFFEDEMGRPDDDKDDEDED
jgi:hypothetical protein